MTCTALRPATAVQYLRMSTDHQRYSLANQAAVISAYADAEGFSVVRTYQDAGVSGVTTTKRLGLKDLLRDVLSPDRSFGTILVLDVSRWGRFQDPDEAAHYEFVCREAGVDVRYCAEAFVNDGTGAATIMKHLKRVMAGEYSRELSERLQTAKRRQTVRGFAPGGPAPFGTQRQTINPDGSHGSVLGLGERKIRLDQDVRWTPGPADQLRTMRRIFRAFTAERRGVTEIARELNQRGWFYPDGSPWTYARVKAALTNEVAVGSFVFNKRPGLFKYPGRVLAVTEWRRVKVFEPIIPPATFRAAAKRFAVGDIKRKSDAEMLDDLRHALSEHGYLSVAIINGHRRTQSSRAYYDRFGSISEAYRLVGYKGERTAILRKLNGKPLTDGDVVERLRSILAREGYLSAALVGADPSVPSAKVIRKRFGRLTTAWALAGFTGDRSEIQRRAMKRGRES